ncbi:MAG: hypothetical protein ACUVXH_09075 [Anaerolineae bacterium]
MPGKRIRRCLTRVRPEIVEAIIVVPLSSRTFWGRPAWKVRPFFPRKGAWNR